MNHPKTGQDADKARRAAWMRVLALADPGALDGAFQRLGASMPATGRCGQPRPAWPWCAPAAAAPAPASTWAK